MLPDSSSSPESFNMLTVLDQWEERSCHHINNIHKYFWLLFFKFVLDVAVFFTCSPKRYTYFLSVCSLSILVADFVLAGFLGSVWLFGSDSSFVPTCIILANASATYGAVPLPMICLGLLDYCLVDTWVNKYTALCKLLRNVILTLLVWTAALVYSFGFFHAQPVQLEYMTGKKVLVCKVDESMMIKAVTLGLFFGTFLLMLPFCSRIPQWARQADRIYETREKREEKRSDLFFTSAGEHNTEMNSKEEKHVDENIRMRPPLWFSLTLGFVLFWMPYLVVTASCLLCGFTVPAHISVNLLWFECTNSFLVGLVFWVKSKTTGPNSNLPDNVCSWQIFWHLSKGTIQSHLPIAVLNQPQDEKNLLLQV